MSGFVLHPETFMDFLKHAVSCLEAIRCDEFPNFVEIF
jgi:hypothetical protein